MQHRLRVAQMHHVMIRLPTDHPTYTLGVIVKTSILKGTSKRLIGAIAATSLVGLAGMGTTPAHAGTITVTASVANRVVQVWSCAVNVPGGGCYRWYTWQLNPPYNPKAPTQIVQNQYVYNRVQL